MDSCCEHVGLCPGRKPPGVAGRGRTDEEGSRWECCSTGLPVWMWGGVGVGVRAHTVYVSGSAQRDAHVQDHDWVAAPDAGLAAQRRAHEGGAGAES